MQATMQIVESVLQVTNRGGRLFARDDNTILVVDYDGITSKLMQQIEEQCPQWTVEVVQADISSSGFVIIFSKNSHARAWQSSSCMQLCLLLLCVFVILLHMHRNFVTIAE